MRSSINQAISQSVNQSISQPIKSQHLKLVPTFVYLSWWHCQISFGHQDGIIRDLNLSAMHHWKYFGMQ